jgi:hypothetical protein
MTQRREIRNAIAEFIGGLNLVQRKPAKGESDVSRFVEGALDGAHRAAGLTRSGEIRTLLDHDSRAGSPLPRGWTSKPATGPGDREAYMLGAFRCVASLWPSHGAPYVAPGNRHISKGDIDWRCGGANVEDLCVSAFPNWSVD